MALLTGLALIQQLLEADNVGGLAWSRHTLSPRRHVLGSNPMGVRAPCASPAIAPESGTGI